MALLKLMPSSSTYPVLVSSRTCQQLNFGFDVESQRKETVLKLRAFPQLDRKEMSFNSLTFDDSGMYQCVAENRHGVIYANAELRVFGESKQSCLKLNSGAD